MYPKGWQQPATYIRSSATVEDCAGVTYCMDEDDEIGLKIINTKLPSGIHQLSEDQFEEVMNFFEETAQAKQPFAAVDSPPVLPLEELEQNYDDTIPDYVRTYSKFVYEHWRSRRTTKTNHSLTPRLKFETGQESDDSDPYVCFRRRELRQVRRTRNRDVQSAEKLRKLRLELETARNMLLMVKQREQQRKELLEVDKAIFEQRRTFREIKRKLGIKGDEHIIVNQKKQKLTQMIPPEQAALAPMRPGVGIELRTLDDVRAERQRAIDNEINLNIEKHIRWNEGYVDKTTAPLTPVHERTFLDSSTQFLEAMPATEYLPTPPASVSEDEGEKVDVEMKDISRSSTPFRYASPADDDTGSAMPSFRRRIGRGGRIIIDRRMPSRTKREFGEESRFRFDDSEDEIGDDGTSFDQVMLRRMTERVLLLTRSSNDAQAQNARRAQIEQANAAHAPPQPSQPSSVTVS